MKGEKLADFRWGTPSRRAKSWPQLFTQGWVLFWWVCASTKRQQRFQSWQGSLDRVISCAVHTSSSIGSDTCFRVSSDSPTHVPSIQQPATGEGPPLHADTTIDWQDAQAENRDKAEVSDEAIRGVTQNTEVLRHQAEHGGCVAHRDRETNSGSSVSFVYPLASECVW